MIVKAADMPTRGVLTTNTPQIEVFPLTFGELIKYLGDEQLTPVREYIRTLKYMISRDENIANISILDADYLVYVFEALSASKEAKITVSCVCDHCGKTHHHGIQLNQVEFNDVSKDSLSIKEVTLGGKRILFKYTTIGEFIDFVGRLGRFAENTSVDVLKLASMLRTNINSAIDLINNSVQEDIALIHYLDSVLFKLIKPIEIICPEHANLRGTTATFPMSAVNIFRDIIQFNPITFAQVSFREASENSESR